MSEMIDYRQFLLQALELKRARNPAFSVGAFGRLFGVEASRMGQILRGKVGISIKRAHEIANVLQLPDHEKRMFILLVQAEHDRDPKKRDLARVKLDGFKSEFKSIDTAFNSISDWYHHAIVEILSSDIAPLSEEIIAKKLGISIDIVSRAIERLLENELICKSMDDEREYKVNSVTRRTAQDIPSEAVKILNEQILEKAKYEIRNQDIKNRDYSVIFFKVNKDQLPRLKEKIQAFRREILNEFEFSPERHAVYCMSTQLFELTGKDGEL